MRYNMDFLVAALIFLIVLWHHFMKQRQYAGNKTEKTFQIFMMLGIGDILLDMVSTVVIDNSRPEFARMLYVILLLFYLCQLLIPPVLYLYTLALAGWSVEEKLSGIRCLLLLPTVVLTVLVMGNFQTGLLFSVTANGAYIRGPLYLMMYMQAVWYGLVIGGESIRNYQKLGKRKFGIIWEILFIMVSCVLLQGFYQEVLLTGFAIALCLMVLLLAFQNPYVYTDNLTGLLDMQCFQEWAEEQCRRKRDIHVAVVDLRQLKQLNTIYGVPWTDRFLKIFTEVAGVVVIAGNGNNGGDGYAIARLLNRRGVPVRVFRIAGTQDRSPDCEANYRRWLTRGKVEELKQADDLVLQKGEIVIDAIFGSGLNRPVTGLAARIIKQMNASANRVVAVDIPSGLAGEDNTWNDPETIVCAEYTFTFQFPKLAFMLAENEKYVGRWEVLDIGLHPEIIARQPTDWFYTTEDTVKAILPPSPVFAHKGTNGKGLLIAGSYGMMGAAVLGAKAAVRSGIGLLYCHIPGKGIEVIQTTVPEAIPDPDESAERFSAVCKLIAVGPAIGQGPETVGGLEKLLRTWRGTTILDADALNIIAEHRELLDLLHEGCILTPHMKEFERLAGKSVNDFERLNKLSIFAKQYRVHIVLKGAHSVIATPDRRLFFNMSGNPGMAKGGAGGVLTGVLLALAANKLNLLDLLRIGVFAHGLAGDCVAEKEGRRGCCAGMIAERMGEAWKRLEK